MSLFMSSSETDTTTPVREHTHHYREKQEVISGKGEMGWHAVTGLLGAANVLVLGRGGGYSRVCFKIIC